MSQTALETHSLEASTQTNNDQSNHSPANMCDMSDKETVLVKKTCEYLQAHLADAHSLATLAIQMGTNRNRLTSSFKQVLGIGVMAWLREQRMAKAKLLLNTTDLSIKQICYEVGYRDPANFSTTFKASYQVSPLVFRKK
ncbi:helix-turn-helix domain-containing protein [Spartinivicinus poritis]|uniref:AraC family transcriptional regulator n=1 Tax=Spartinivicinus poritis TaxID=2994640 RepID=A0ABT5U9C4_9GAMM|nr:AraC family transcriptional regulator [Spartinivicinus sp. A2-2]MDE1462162.1 AraC family transcriptional regulator [Spartinivicinus sp. A2-2]